MSLFHRSPGVGFEQPYEMLEACHERVQRTLDLLLRLQAHLVVQGADQQARDAARDILRYFDLAAPQHHEDEERHVLPRLREAGLGPLADRLAQEHRRMSAAYAALRPGLVGLAEQGAMPATAEWAAFAALYRAHIDCEEQHAFPAARAGMSEEAARSMGDEMRVRRQAPPA
jgi:hemerythrin-like domain-containing protein